MHTIPFWPLLSAAFLVVVIVPLLAFPARALGLVDHPGGRKDHVGEVPLTGGIAITLAFTLAWLSSVGLEDALPLLAAMWAIVLVGVIDDSGHLSPVFRLTTQVVVAGFAVIVGGVEISHLGDFPRVGRVELELIAVPFTILCLVGLINAVNMADGVDGLASGMVAIMLAWLVVLAAITGAPQGLVAPAILLGAVLGFLLWNFPLFGGRPAFAFLGDAGSMALGLSLGWVAIKLAIAQNVGVPPMSFAWILAVPVIETVVVMLRRIMRGHNPLHPDREHLHHHLLRLGVSRRIVTLVILSAVGFSGAFGILGWRAEIPDWFLFGAFAMAGLIHLLFMELVLSRIETRISPGTESA
jgi:UDP-GlcNAc:undecaprenyl-phosphate/decaprenyl-phosphate GlcNAc-1-phosphate transferase